MDKPIRKENQHGHAKPLQVSVHITHITKLQKTFYKWHFNRRQSESSNRFRQSFDYSCRMHFLWFMFFLKWLNPFLFRRFSPIHIPQFLDNLFPKPLEKDDSSVWSDQSVQWWLRSLMWWHIYVSQSQSLLLPYMLAEHGQVFICLKKKKSTCVE